MQVKVGDGRQRAAEFGDKQVVVHYERMNIKAKPRGLEEDQQT